MNLEILNASYWEQFKFAQELAGYLDLNHPKRIRVEKELNIILKKLQDARRDQDVNRTA